MTIFVALLLLGGASAYSIHAGEELREEQRTVATWETDSEFHHAGTVQRESEAFDRGERLENRTLYFSELTPTLEGAYVYEHGGDAGEAIVVTELRLEWRSVSDGGEREHWRVTEPIERSDSTVAPGERHRTEFTVNSTALAERLAAIEDDLGATPGRSEVRLVAVTHAETTMEGDPHDERREEALAFDLGDGTYELSTATEGTRTERLTEPVEISTEPPLWLAISSVLLLLVGAGGTAGLYYGRREGYFDVETDEREEFEEWISRGEPPSADGRETLRIASLAELVDVAIDCNRRVIDADGAFYVVVDDVRYVYRPDDHDTGP